jgi:hypothetical protein
MQSSPVEVGRPTLLYFCSSKVSKQAEKRASGSVSFGVVDLWGMICSDFVFATSLRRSTAAKSIKSALGRV